MTAPARQRKHAACRRIASAALNAVAALFARRPDAVKRLFYTAAMKELAGPLCAAMAAAHRPYRMLDEAEIDRAAGTVHHGGIVAVAEPRRSRHHRLRAAAAHAAAAGAGRGEQPAQPGRHRPQRRLLRRPALLLHETPRQAMPSDAAYRTAEGGLEHLELHKTRNLGRALTALEPYLPHGGRDADARRDAAAEPAARPPGRPGAGQRGARRVVRGAGGLPPQVRILGAGPVQSLNVAQAAAVLLAALTNPVA